MARPRKHPLPSIDELRHRFTYDHETGIILTRLREGNDPYILSYNRRLANKRVGCIMNAGYLSIYVGKLFILGHRIAWALHYGEWPNGEIDHRDGNKLNNAISNLRIATRAQNIISRKLRGVSKFKGVTPSMNGKKWRSYIRINGRSVYLGTFEREEAAAEAYLRAALETQGEFAFTPCGPIRSTVIISMAA
ncbi:HNH endonuclease [uncultured Novosphingobium sp.]|uniref:HNH endonuclease n=1 Tax=uncultured Novosphingobium sp. TaxID=292277 RepID=UPI0025935465|nr:HNH endonuclease [uncultured Novosphingobium sp.]